VSTGNEVDLDWADYAEYLLDRPDIRVILGFVEGFHQHQHQHQRQRQPARLVAVARKAALLGKPIVIAKIGRSEAGRRAAASHTGSLVGADAAHSAVFRQLGIVRVDDVDEMLDLAAYFSIGRLPAGRRVAVLTASGGAGAWLADACAARGLELPPPDAADQATIRSFIPAYGSVGNPVDITAQAALEGGFERALAVLAESSRFDVVVPVGTLVREKRFFETLPELKSALTSSQAAVAYYTYTRASPSALSALNELGVPCFSTPGRTARALSAAVEYAEFLGRLDDVAVFRTDTTDLTTWPSPTGRLSETLARTYLAGLGIASPDDRAAKTADEAVAAFEAMGGKPVALKVQSPDLAHKTDVGGVRLGLRSSAEVRAAFVEVVDNTRAVNPDARLDGLLVQRMAPAGIEAFVAARREPLLGPLVVVGLGGVDVEALGDVAMRLAPVSLAEAREMVGELRGSAILRGTRGRPPADVEALARAVVSMSVLAGRLPAAVQNVEINPLLVLAAGEGVLMLDAAIEMQTEVAGDPQ
jgi:acyl-CoA synthetase (NDP forming)